MSSVAVLRIARGGSGSPDRTESFEVPYTPGQSVLDGLMWIREHADPSLAFRFACINANVCKECVMRIDGKNAYACTQRLKPGETPAGNLSRTSAAFATSPATRSRRRSGWFATDSGPDHRRRNAPPIWTGLRIRDHIGINVACRRRVMPADRSWPERARSVTPLLRERAATIEAERKLAADVLDALHERELFRLSLPARVGGYELPIPVLAAVTEIIAGADASAAWCLGQAFGLRDVGGLPRRGCSSRGSSARRTRCWPGAPVLKGRQRRPTAATS